MCHHLIRRGQGVGTLGFRSFDAPSRRDARFLVEIARQKRWLRPCRAMRCSSALPSAGERRVSRDLRQRQRASAPAGRQCPMPGNHPIECHFEGQRRSPPEGLAYLRTVKSLQPRLVMVWTVRPDRVDRRASPRRLHPLDDP